MVSLQWFAKHRQAAQFASPVRERIPPIQVMVAWYQQHGQLSRQIGKPGPYLTHLVREPNVQQIPGDNQRVRVVRQSSHTGCLKHALSVLMTALAKPGQVAERSLAEQLLWASGGKACGVWIGDMGNDAG